MLCSEKGKWHYKRDGGRKEHVIAVITGLISDILDIDYAEGILNRTCTELQMFLLKVKWPVEVEKNIDGTNYWWEKGNIGIRTILQMINMGLSI